MAKVRDRTAMRVIIALLCFVGTLWAGSLVLDMFNPNYDPPETIGLAFMAVLSTLLGMLAATQRDGGKKDDDEGKDEDA